MAEPLFMPGADQQPEDCPFAEKHGGCHYPICPADCAGRPKVACNCQCPQPVSGAALVSGKTDPCSLCNDSGTIAVHVNSGAYIAPGPVPETARHVVEIECDRCGGPAQRGGGPAQRGA